MPFSVKHRPFCLRGFHVDGSLVEENARRCSVLSRSQQRSPSPPWEGFSKFDLYLLCKRMRPMCVERGASVPITRGWKFAWMPKKTCHANFVVGSSVFQVPGSLLSSVGYSLYFLAMLRGLKIDWPRKLLCFFSHLRSGKNESQVNEVNSGH